MAGSLGYQLAQRFYSPYGEMRPDGKWIDRARVEEETSEYLVQRFPRPDYAKQTQILK